MKHIDPAAGETDETLEELCLTLAHHIGFAMAQLSPESLIVTRQFVADKMRETFTTAYKAKMARAN